MEDCLKTILNFIFLQSLNAIAKLYNKITYFYIPLSQHWINLNIPFHFLSHIWLHFDNFYWIDFFLIF